MLSHFRRLLQRSARVCNAAVRALLQRRVHDGQRRIQLLQRRIQRSVGVSESLPLGRVPRRKGLALSPCTQPPALSFYPGTTPAAPHRRRSARQVHRRSAHTAGAAPTRSTGAAPTPQAQPPPGPLAQRPPVPLPTRPGTQAQCPPAPLPTRPGHHLVPNRTARPPTAWANYQAATNWSLLVVWRAPGLFAGVQLVYWEGWAEVVCRI